MTKPTPIRTTDTLDAAFVARIEALGFVPTGTPDEYLGRCLNSDHADKKPSCSINARKEMGLCHGCGAKWNRAELAATLDKLSTPTTPPARPVRPASEVRSARGRLVATYDYVDAAGALVFQVTRWEDPKRFTQRRAGPAPGSWINDVKGVVKVPFHLSMVVKAIAHGTPIVVVEGEQCAKALAPLKIVATTVAGGSNAWQDTYAPHFADADVIIWPDHDVPGHTFAVAVAASLLAVAKRVRWVDSSGAVGDDVVDLLAAEGAAAVHARLASARDIRSKRDIPPNPHDTPTQLHVIDVVTELPTYDFPEREMLLTPFLETGSLTLPYGPPGVGKTRFAMALAAALATGGTVGRYHAHRPARVLYVDGELQGHRARDIFAQALRAVVGVPAEGFLTLITPDAQPDAFAPNLAEIATQRALLDCIDRVGAEVLFLDNLSCLWSVEDDNASSQWDDIQGFLLTLRRRGIATVLLHHAGKSGTQLGTSKKEFIFDTVIKLSRPDDYDASQGTRFLVEYQKARGFIAGAERFEAALVEVGGVTRWKHYAPTNPRVEAVQTAIEALRAKGKPNPSNAAVAEATGLNRNMVQRLRLRLKDSP